MEIGEIGIIESVLKKYQRIFGKLLGKYLWILKPLLRTTKRCSGELLTVFWEFGNEFLRKFCRFFRLLQEFSKTFGEFLPNFWRIVSKLLDKFLYRKTSRKVSASSSSEFLRDSKPTKKGTSMDIDMEIFLGSSVELIPGNVVRVTIKGPSAIHVECFSGNF